MELRALRCFLLVAEELHFGRAAVRLNLSQPALTQLIQRLEADLDVRLFDRNRRSVRLTCAGTALMREARAILLQVERATNVVKRAQSTPAGHVRIGFVPAALVAGLGKVFYAARAKLPGLTETWIEIDSAEQIIALQQTRIDIGFAHTPLDYGAIRALPLIRQALVAAMPERHPLARQPHVRLDALTGEEFLVSPREVAPGYYSMVQAACNQAGFNPRVEQQARHLFALVNLVSMGLGLALVPASFRSLTIPGVVFRDIVDQTLEIELSALWNPHSERPIVSRLLDLLRGELTAQL